MSVSCMCFVGFVILSCCTFFFGMGMCCPNLFHLCIWHVVLMWFPLRGFHSIVMLNTTCNKKNLLFTLNFFVFGVCFYKLHHACLCCSRKWTRLIGWWGLHWGMEVHGCLWGLPNMHVMLGLNWAKHVHLWELHLHPWWDRVVHG